MASDPNMDTLYYWARSCNNTPILPQSLWNTRKRAEFLNSVDSNLISAQSIWEFDSIQRMSFKNNIELKTSTQLYDVTDPVDRFVITGVLWSGCLDAAKATRENLTDFQRLDWSNKIESRTSDSLYIQGVEVGPILRKIRDQPVYSNGIPINSTLIKFI